MIIKKELEDRVNSFSPSNNKITISTYGGINFLHIDFYYDSTAVAWTQICVNAAFIELKIADFNSVYFKIDGNGEEVIKEIINFAKYIGCDKIFSRIVVNNNFNELKKFYTKFGFDIKHTPKEKSYDSAKICKLF